ncbi:hypothetical protein sscle_04g033660 [Sclerotinia sclerotiorum 1980 UF-70]|uniref:ABC transporter family G domain-containing protein n=1 Tax=Sclerotinia sclerotiorum (strain ATCC 18683 / 1980 / Ss-1) TaxID=665079 RepID=A0A1D9Q109_SCLS1|nr:hypothetical protein sscle_04g033660 [Sclerotinia sclerotiorum 1980 UF-70]
MAVFGLSHTYNTKVGNDFLDLPIAAWDNSTRGLDAATALEFTKSLRMTANLCGSAHWVVIYQASQQIYDEFDKAVVLYEGRQVYFGPCDQARQYFVDMGLECPNRQTTENFDFVEDVIKMLNMEDFSEAVVGVLGEGLNVEQRKLLTIGVELAAKPALLLFLDEPTSGRQMNWRTSNELSR